MLRTVDFFTSSVVFVRLNCGLNELTYIGLKLRINQIV